jgi:uncharacterized membrane protein
MRASARLSSFVRSDPDYAPFGMTWLRGLTPARVGLVFAICLLFAIQSGAMPLLQQEPPEPILVWIAAVAEDAALTFLTIAPTLLLVIIADNVGARSPTAVRVGGLVIAVVLGAALYAGFWSDECDEECVAKLHKSRFVVVHFARAASWGAC